MSRGRGRLAFAVAGPTSSIVRLLAAVVAIAIAVAAVVAEDATDSASRWTKAIAAVTGTGSAADVESLSAALAALPGLHAVIRAGEGVDPLDESSRLSCDLAILVESSAPGDGKARSIWRIVDPGTGKDLRSGIVEGLEPTPRDLAEFWWLPIVEAVESLLPRPVLAGFRVEAAAGTIVAGLGPEPLVMPESGYVEFPKEAPMAIAWRATSKGAYPERGRINAAAGTVLRIPRVPYRRLTLESGLLMAQFPDLWLAWRLADDFIALKAGSYQFIAGLSLAEASDGDRAPSYLASLPLIQPGLGFSIYLLPSDAAFRPYFGATAFARLLVSPEAAAPFDGIAPFGMMPVAGAEWAASRRLGLFIEAGIAYYPCDSGELMAASLPDGGRDRAIAYGEHWFIEFPTVRVGARFTP